jgi:hypothetical protein
MGLQRPVTGIALLFNYINRNIIESSNWNKFLDPICGFAASEMDSEVFLVQMDVLTAVYIPERRNYTPGEARNCP